MNGKLIAFDLDGTLLRNDKSLTDRSLRALDHYMQDCIRYLATGTRGKQRFSLRYETMKQWGYRPLVHAYYTGLAGPSAEEAPPPPADGSA